ncbi:hypothetical protein E2320_022648, partial [Naja naja]
NHPAKKAKKHGGELPASPADNNSSESTPVSQPEEEVYHSMPQLQTPNSANSQNMNNVYLDMVQEWENPIQNFMAVEYYQRYRFVNVDRIQSFVHAIEAIHNAIQNLLNNVARDIGPNHFVQLRLDADGLNHPLFSLRRNMDDLNADDFLTSIENLLQSKAEILRFRVTIKILFYLQDGWRFFVTGRSQQEKIVFILLHGNHYYAIKNIKGFLGERYFCKFCHTHYHHKFSHGCQYICRACLKQECQQVEKEKMCCYRCKVLCHSK